MSTSAGPEGLRLSFSNFQTDLRALFSVSDFDAQSRLREFQLPSEVADLGRSCFAFPVSFAGTRHGISDQSLVEIVHPKILLGLYAVSSRIGMVVGQMLVCLFVAIERPVGRSVITPIKGTNGSSPVLKDVIPSADDWLDETHSNPLLIRVLRC